VIESPDGKELFIVYHTHQQPAHPSWTRQLSIDRLTFEPGSNGGPDRIAVKGPTDTPQPMPSGAPPIVRGRNEEFDSGTLDRSRWTVFRERPRQWKVAEGALVIDPDRGDVREQNDDLRNLFLCYPPEKRDFSVTTRVRFRPDRPGDQAFLCLWQNHNDFVRLAVTRGDSDTPKFQIAFERAATWSASDFDDNLGEDVLLRIDVVDGSVAFHASGDGGKTWPGLSKPTKLNLLAPRVGIGAIGASASPPAAFDFVHFGEPSHN
jgi:hypothetical protein